MEDQENEDARRSAVSREERWDRDIFGDVMREVMRERREVQASPEIKEEKSAPDAQFIQEYLEFLRGLRPCASPYVSLYRFTG